MYLRKTFAILLSIIILAGCFHAKQKPQPEQPQKPAAAMTETNVTAVPQAPSFQDGDYYLQALSKKDRNLCVSIRNQKLKERCEIDANK